MLDLSEARRRLYKYIFEPFKTNIEEKLKIPFQEFCTRASIRKLSKKEIFEACEIANCKCLDLIYIGDASWDSTERKIEISQFNGN